MRRLHFGGGLAAFFLLCSPAVLAAIHGAVQDSTGAIVPGARIYLLKPPAAARAVTADAAGLFGFDESGDGECTVFASAPGLTAEKIRVACRRAEPLILTLRPSALVETVVVQAERAELPSTAVAASVSVLTSAELEAMQALQLLDALRYIPGVEVNQTGRRGGVTALFVRGGESKYNLVTLDGVKVNDFGGFYNFAGLPAEQAERVEVVRGPQSALYGSYAIGSAVHVVTPSGLDRRDLFASAEGGNFATRHFTAGGGDRFGNLGVHASASRLQSDGAVINDDSRIDNGHIKADYLLRPRQRLQYSFLVQSNEYGNPGAIGVNPTGRVFTVDTVSRTQERYNVHSFRYDGELGRRLRQRLGGAIYNYRLDARSRFGASFSRQSRHAFTTETTVALSGRSLLLFGMEWNGERFRNTFLTDSAFAPFPLDRNIYGGFVQHHFEHGGRLFLNAGVRWEHLRLESVPAGGARPPFAASAETQTHPRASLAFLLRPTTRLHASGGTGLRPPDGFEIAFTDNPALKPERTTSVDAGAEQAFLDRRVAVDVTWFFNRFHDQIVTLSRGQTGLSRWRSDNLSNTETKGLEISLQLQPTRELRLRGSYTYLDTQVLALDGSSEFVRQFFRPGQQLHRRPRHAASYLATWRHRRLLVDAGAVLRGRTLDVDPGSGAGGGQFLNPFYATFDAGAQWELGGGVTATAKLRNLLDRRYEESLGFPALGRNFTVGLRWRWRPD